MKTIIQTIGPLYGEVVNGTVFGQPNGSVYTPPANLLVVLKDSTSAVKYVKNGSAYVDTYTATYAAVAVMFQVLAQVDTWKFKTELATDAAFTSIVSSGTYKRPTGSTTVPLGGFGLNSGYTVVNGTTYYARLKLLDLLGNEMAVSDTYTFEGLV